MIAEFASSLWWRRSFTRHGWSWKELEEFPGLAPGRQRRILAERLLATIRYFANRADALPEWREAARIRTPEELWCVWPTLPVVDKRMLRSRFHPKEMQERFGMDGIPDATGGSTGEPTPFFHDRLMRRKMIAAINYTRLRMGWRPGMATIIVWGSERDIGKQVDLRNRVFNRLFRDYMVDGYGLSRATVERVLGLIEKTGPAAIYGFTSMLEYIAREAKAMGRAPAPGKVRCAWNGGEMLFPEQSRLFESVFGTPILNRYGGRELGCMACQFEAGAPLEIMRPWLFAEVVDERGRPVPPGEPGRLLWTSTVCRGTPFLRYDIEDIASFDTSDQDEAGVSRLRELHGRSAGLLELPDGRKVSCLYWNHLFKEFSEVRQFQVVLLRDGGLRLLLKGDGFADGREARLRAMLRNFLGDLRVDVQWVDAIPLTAQGKLVQVVREAAAPNGA